jgi:glucokinase
MSAWFREASPQSILMSAEDICALARQQDRLAVQAVEREGYYLGLGLANIVTLFTPEEIALGGGVMKSSELFLGHAINVVRQVCTQVPAEKTSIKLASLGSNTALLGAAQAWLQRNL